MPLRKGTHRSVRTIAATALLAVAGVIAAPAASARGLLSLVTDSSSTATARTTSGSCPQLPTTKAFAAWGDGADYSVLPGGGFEPGTTGWQLNTGSARIVADQDRHNVGGPGTRALELGAPSSAASPAICVDTTNPHFKFMVKTVKRATITTIIQYQRADGSWANAMSAQATRSPSDWTPTDPNPLSASIPGLVAGKTAKVRLWWMNNGGISRIDSVMVDPYRRR